MGKVTIDPATPKDPITIIGRMIGVCYGSDTTNPQKNYKRGLTSVMAGHGRCLEYAECFMVISGYSARVVRELYTHIGGAPTRTQASTRYINYDDFSYIVPPKIESNPEALEIYSRAMQSIRQEVADLMEIGITKEDVANLLPLGMTTVVSARYNARTLTDMASQRLCQRAYWEYRILMKDIIKALSEYSEEWATLCSLMTCKCDKVGYCLEEYSCGKYPKKEIDK